MLTAALLVLSFYMHTPDEQDSLQDDSSLIPQNQEEERDPPEEIKDVPFKDITEGIGSYIGKSKKQFVKDFGEPDMKTPSAYGYEWWIYHKDEASYMQAGVKNDEIVTVYASGQKWDVSPFKMGQSIEAVYRSTMLEAEVVIKSDQGTYRFELSEEDLNIRPLISLGNLYAQLSIDKFTGSIFSVRFMDKSTLIGQRPYELIYRGDLEETQSPDDELWKKIEEGSERQIFYITNVFRRQFDLPALKWHESVAQAAYKHSKDMHENDYFAHDSPASGNLSNRLDQEQVSFQSAGENIAAGYMDGPAAVEGWINSDTHRKALLSTEYTHLGVGVYKKNYTQNFIKPKK